MLPENPYHAWLGLPEDLRQPNHYQLLQISPTDCSREAVVAAAHAQVAKLRRCAKTAPKEAVRALAKEIEAAANCLGSTRARERYNQRLLTELAAGTAPPSPPRPATAPPPESAGGELPEDLPVAIPLDDESAVENAGGLLAVNLQAENSASEPVFIVAANEPLAAPALRETRGELPRIAEPTLAERTAAQRRSQRRSPWGAVAAGLAAAVLLLATVGLILRPDLLDRLLGRNTKVVARQTLDHTLPQPLPQSSPRTPSPLDRALLTSRPQSPSGTATVPQPNSPPGTDDVQTHPPAPPVPTDPQTEPDDGNATPTTRPEMAPPTNAAESSADGGGAEAAAPPAAPAAFIAPPTPEALPSELVDVLLAASLYSVALGNFEAAAELYSHLDLPGLSPEQSGRAARVAVVADTHRRFQQCVLKTCDQVAGGTNLELPGNRSLGIVEASPQLVVLKILGANRRYPPELMPTEIGLAFAQQSAAPAELAVFQATEALLLEVRAALRGKGWDQAALQAKLDELQGSVGDTPESAALLEFCRVDLPVLLRDRTDRSLWTAAAGDPQPWLEPLQGMRASVRPVQALGRAWEQADPAGRGHLYRDGIGELLQQQQLAALAIAVTVGQLNDPPAASGLLAKIELNQLTRPEAIGLTRVLIDRIAAPGEASRSSLQRICRQVVAKHDLPSYGHVLDQLAEPGE